MTRQHNRGGRKQQPRLLPFVVAVMIGMVAFVAIGFGLFIGNLPPPPRAETAKADGIVALTGQGGRLGPALNLLDSGNGKRLLITGVNRMTSRPYLKKLLRGGPSFDCCVDLGFTAVDTRGNAREAARWARTHHYRSVIIVTAAYHMPRSLVEFSAQMPGVELVPYPVPGDAPKPVTWEGAKRLTGEYVKYLASVLRVSLIGVPRDA